MRFFLKLSLVVATILPLNGWSQASDVAVASVTTASPLAQTAQADMQAFIVGQTFMADLSMHAGRMYRQQHAFGRAADGKLQVTITWKGETHVYPATIEPDGTLVYTPDMLVYRLRLAGDKLTGTIVNMVRPQYVGQVVAKAAK